MDESFDAGMRGFFGDPGHAGVRAASAFWTWIPGCQCAAETDEPEKRKEAECKVVGIPGPLFYPQSDEGNNNTVDDEGH